MAIMMPTIDPILLEIGPLAIRWYSLAYVVGLLGGWWLVRRLGEGLRLQGRAAPNNDDWDDLLIWIALGIILGGRLGYVLFYNAHQYLANPIEIIAIWRGGMSFHGGLAGAVLAIVLFCKHKQKPLLTTLDLIAAVAPIGLFFGRIANFINQELWGRITDVPWGIIFPAAGTEPRHPSQLYEAALEGLGLFIVLQMMIRSGALNRPGLIAGTFGVGYALSRIFVEFFREPDAQLGFLWGSLTMGMLLSLPMLALGLWLMMRAKTGSK